MFRRLVKLYIVGVTYQKNALISPNNDPADQVLASPVAGASAKGISLQFRKGISPVDEHQH